MYEIDDENYIKLKDYHKHDCKICPVSLCKNKVICEYLQNSNKKFEKIYYIGDGDNDYCPGLILKEKDYFFPRKNYPLAKLLELEEKSNQIKANIKLWTDGNDIKEEIIKSLSIIN